MSAKKGLRSGSGPPRAAQGAWSHCQINTREVATQAIWQIQSHTWIQQNEDKSGAGIALRNASSLSLAFFLHKAPGLVRLRTGRAATGGSCWSPWEWRRCPGGGRVASPSAPAPHRLALPASPGVPEQPVVGGGAAQVAAGSSGRELSVCVLLARRLQKGQGLRRQPSEGLGRRGLAGYQSRRSTSGMSCYFTTFLSSRTCY